MTQQTPAIFPNTGLASYGEASPEYELAPIGIASMPEQVKRLAEFGRNGDIYVIHAAQGETVIPMEVLDANPQIKALLFNQMQEMGIDPERYIVGNELNSINPVTGMPEFFLSSIFKSVKKVVKKVVKIAKKIAPYALPIAAGLFGIPFMPALGLGSVGMWSAGSMASMALSSGIGTLIGGGSLKDAFKSALIAGGTAGIFGGLKGLASAPDGTGMQGFFQGVKSAATGVTPVFDAAGKLIGSQAAPTAAQTWDAITSGDFSGAFKGTGGTFQPSAEVGSLTAQGGQALSAINPATGVPFGATRFAGVPQIDASVVSPTSGVTKFVGAQPDTAAYNMNLLGDGTVPVPKPPVDTAARSSWSLSELNPFATKTAPAVSNTTLINNEAVRLLAEPNNILTRGEAVKLATESIGAAAAKGPLLGSFSPSKLLGIPKGGSNLVDLGLGLGGTYLAGGFEPTPEEDPEDVKQQALAALDPIVIDPLAAQAAQIDVTTQVPTTTAADLLQPSIFTAAHGGAVNYPRREALVEGPGTMTSDDIPAMLSDGEFVINSKAVQGADPSGMGNRYAGAQNLYNMMRNFEMRA